MQAALKMLVQGIHAYLETAMPAKSQSQQKAAGAALAAKRGEKELEELASTKRKGKPEHVSDKEKEKK